MKFRVYGHVKDSTTGKAITGTIIKIYLNKEEIQKGKSVENGFYELVVEIDDSCIESGQQLKITFESEGYKPQEHLVLATEGNFNLDVAFEIASSQSHFNWTPIIVAGIALLVILIGGAIAWWLISRPASPKIINFSADPNSVIIGKSAMLSWETSNALNVFINPNIGSVNTSGSKTVSPPQTTTYTLIAKNEKGKTVEKTVQVHVSIPPSPQIAFFEASPPTIKKGEQATLSWETSNAVDLKILPDVGGVSASGSKAVSPQQTTNYTLIAKNEEGTSVEKEVQIQVIPLISTSAKSYNNDQFTDIVFHRPGSTWSTVPVLFAKGDGTWNSTNNSAPGWANQPGVIAIPGDFNTDGFTDIAFHRPGSSWSTVPVLFARGNGTWNSTNNSAPGWANQPGVIAIPGDFNTDGFTDIAFHRPGSSWSTVPVLFAKGDGTWNSTNNSAPGWANQPGVIAIPGDFNTDRFMDIAFYHPGSTWSTVPVLFAKGDGTWNSTNNSAPGWANQPSVIAIPSDFNTKK